MYIKLQLCLMNAMLENNWSLFQKMQLWEVPQGINI